MNRLEAAERNRTSYGARCILLALALVAAACTGDTNRLLRVGIPPEYRPFVFRDGEGGLRGLDVEIVERMAADLGLRIGWVSYTWPRLSQEVGSGAVDLAIGGVTVRPERAVVGRYTRPYATVGAVALVRSEEAERFSTPDEIAHPRVRIVVNAGGHLESLARTRFRPATVLPVPGDAGLADRVFLGSADVALTDSAEATSWMRPGLTAVGPFTRDAKAFLLTTTRSELARRIDDWFAAREADGWLRERRAAWLSGQVADPAAAPDPVATLVRLRLDLMPLVAAAKGAAGLDLEDRAQEERVRERVGRLAGSRATEIDRIYRILITTARLVQRNAPRPVPGPSLDELRAAIERIDEVLVREILAAPPRSAGEWRTVLDVVWQAPTVTEAEVATLAEALAKP